MAVRISGVTIPNDKRVEISLTYIFGIGPTSAKNILEQTKIDSTRRVKDLTDEEVNQLRSIIEKQHLVEGDLRREVVGNIKRLKEVGSYRGDRHSKNLPVRGQRTKTNNRTVRGNTKRTMGSGRRAIDQKT